MNKRRNKSVTKTKHRVQKTKRNRRLNKNRSVKGIRGNNKTKVVGKRRKIVQSGGGPIEELIRQIDALNDTTIDQVMRTHKVTYLINWIRQQDILSRRSTQPPYIGQSILYAACNLDNPSSDLVRGILKLMAECSPPLEISDPSPCQAAVDVVRRILTSSREGDEDHDIKLMKIKDILVILALLKSYDNIPSQLKNKVFETPKGLEIWYTNGNKLTPSSMPSKLITDAEREQFITKQAGYSIPDLIKLQFSDSDATTLLDRFNKLLDIIPLQHPAYYGPETTYPPIDSTLGATAPPMDYDYDVHQTQGATAPPMNDY